jgi:hypothetical protein
MALPGIEDTVQILDVDPFRVDQHELAEAEPVKLFDDDAACARGADHGGRQVCEFSHHLPTERSGRAANALWARGHCRASMPELQVIADNRNRS